MLISFPGGTFRQWELISLPFFPDMCETVLSESIIGRARKGALSLIACKSRTSLPTSTQTCWRYLSAAVWVWLCNANLFTTVLTRFRNNLPKAAYLVYICPQTLVLNQKKLLTAKISEYLHPLRSLRGVDQRILDTIADEEISAGDYVFSPAANCLPLYFRRRYRKNVRRYLSSPWMLAQTKAFDGLLWIPQYTRPETRNGLSAPSCSGHHSIRVGSQQSIVVTKALHALTFLKIRLFKTPWRKTAMLDIYFVTSHSATTRFQKVFAAGIPTCFSLFFKTSFTSSYNFFSFYLPF